MVARQDIDARKVVVVVDEAVFLKPGSCPEIDALPLHCTVRLSLCLLRRCRIDISPATATTGEAVGVPMWDQYCQMLPEEMEAPVFLPASFDPVLSLFTRHRLEERRAVFKQLDAVLERALRVWRGGLNGSNSSIETSKLVDLDASWKALSMIMSRCWNSERFGCACIPVLELANHRRGGPKLTRVYNVEREVVSDGSLSQGDDTATASFGFVTPHAMKKGEEFFVSYDDPDGCDVDLWLDYGFIDGGTRRPCAHVVFGDPPRSLKLRRNHSVQIEGSALPQFREAVRQLLQQSTLAAAALRDAPFFHHRAVAQTLQASEHALLEEVLRSID